MHSLSLHVSTELQGFSEVLTVPSLTQELMCERRGMAAYISCAAPLSHHFLHSVNLEDPRTELPKADTAFYRTVMVRATHLCILMNPNPAATLACKGASGHFTHAEQQPHLSRTAFPLE